MWLPSITTVIILQSETSKLLISLDQHQNITTQIRTPSKADQRWKNSLSASLPGFFETVSACGTLESPAHDCHWNSELHHRTRPTPQLSSAGWSWREWVGVTIVTLRQQRNESVRHEIQSRRSFPSVHPYLGEKRFNFCQVTGWLEKMKWNEMGSSWWLCCVILCCCVSEFGDSAVHASLNPSYQLPQ